MNRPLTVSERATLWAADYARITPTVCAPCIAGVVQPTPPHILKLYAEAASIRESVACVAQRDPAKAAA